MYRKVSELRLADRLAEPPLVGAIVGLKLDDEGRAHIEFINEGVPTRDPFLDLEIRPLSDHIEIELKQAS